MDRLEKVAFHVITIMLKLFAWEEKWISAVFPTFLFWLPSCFPVSLSLAPNQQKQIHFVPTALRQPKIILYIDPIIHKNIFLFPLLLQLLAKQFFCKLLFRGFRVANILFSLFFSSSPVRAKPQKSFPCVLLTLMKKN